MPPPPDLLPALRNAALFGQISRETRRQIANSLPCERCERYEVVGKLSISMLLGIYPLPVTRTLRPPALIGHCKATVVRRIVPRTACPNWQSLHSRSKS